MRRLVGRDEDGLISEEKMKNPSDVEALSTSYTLSPSSILSTHSHLAEGKRESLDIVQALLSSSPNTRLLSTLLVANPKHSSKRLL